MDNSENTQAWREALIEEWGLRDRYVQCVAIKDHDGTLYSLPRPARHYQVIALMVQKGRPTPISGQQGFLLDDGTFADRRTAKHVAILASQLLDTAFTHLDELFSEDVW
jgi:hypothetical protein